MDNIKPNNNSESIKTQNIDKIFQSFLDNIKSVHIFFNKLSPAAVSEDEAIKEDYKKYIKDVFGKVFGSETIKMFEINESTFKPKKEQIREFTKKILKAPNLPAKNHDILTRSSFIMLNNYFEYLFSDLLTYYFRKNNGFLNNKVNININDLKKYNSIEEACEDIIYREVEAMLIEMNFEELKNFFNTKLKIDFEEALVDWNKINEIRERRHIIIHNNATVNNKYISRSNNPYHLKLNSTVAIDENYFEESYQIIYKAGLLILFNCWGKWENASSTKAIAELLKLSFSFLTDKNYDMTTVLAQYAANKIVAKNDDDEDALLRIKFNKCIALKKLNQTTKLTKELSEIKTGVLSPIFKVAHLLLKEEYDTAITHIPNAIVTNKITLEQYMEWPLFDDIRSSQIHHDKVIAFFN